MKIYAISDQLDGGMTWAFRGTKKAAQAYVLERLDQCEKEDLSDAALPEITDYEVIPTKEGIADDLNRFVEWTCMNEH